MIYDGGLFGVPAKHLGNVSLSLSLNTFGSGGEAGGYNKLTAKGPASTGTVPHPLHLSQLTHMNN